MTPFAMGAVIFIIAITLFAAGFYIYQKRFWSQDRNNSRTAPPSTKEGIGTRLDDKRDQWRPPRAS